MRARLKRTGSAFSRALPVTETAIPFSSASASKYSMSASISLTNVDWRESHGGVTGIGAGQKEEVLDDAAEPLVFLQARLEDAAVLLGGPRFPEGHLGLSPEIVDRRPKLMGEIRRKLRKKGERMLQAFEHGVEGGRERRDLRWPMSGAHPRIEFFGGDPLEGPGDVRERLQTRLGNDEPESHRQDKAREQDGEDLSTVIRNNRRIVGPVEGDLNEPFAGFGLAEFDPLGREQEESSVAALRIHAADGAHVKGRQWAGKSLRSRRCPSFPAFRRQTLPCSSSILT